MATTGVVNGNNILVYVGGVAIGCGTDAQFQSDNEEVVATCKDNNGAKQVLSGSNSWSISFNGLFKFDAAYGAMDLAEAHLNGDTVVVKMGNAVLGDKYFTGSAKILNFQMGAPLNAASTFSCTFVGDGPWTIGTN